LEEAEEELLVSALRDAALNLAPEDEI